MSQLTTRARHSPEPTRPLYYRTLAFPRSRLFPALLCALVLLAIIGWGAVLDGPIMASDAYAYFAPSSLRVPLDKLYLLDPYLQRVNSPGFFLLGRLATALAGGDGTPVIKIVNAASFVLAACLLVSCIGSTTFRRERIAGLALLLAMPLSTYCQYFMPEALYFLGVAALTVVVVRSADPIGGWHALIAGAVVGLLGSLKPHAAAIMLALASYVLVQNLWRYRPLRGTLVSFPPLALCLVGAASTYWLTNLLFHGSAQTPRLRLVGEGYLPLLDLALAGRFKLATLATVLANHLLLLAAVFAVPLVLQIRWVADLWARRHHDAAEDPGLRRLFLFSAWSILVLTSSALMAVFFTALLTDSDEPAQITRVHGRYYSFSLALTLASFFASVRPMSVRPWFGQWTRSAAALSAIAVTVYILAAHRWIDVYPWDFPELLGFGRPWTGDRDFQLGLPSVVAMILIACAITLAFRVSWTFWVTTLSVGATFVAGLLATCSWQRGNSIDYGIITREARSLRDLLPESELDRGLVVGDERYGRMSYALYGIRTPCRVLQRPALSTLSATDIPSGTRWVVTVGPIAVESSPIYSIAGRHITFYRLNPLERFESDAIFSIDLATDSATSLLEGFHVCEDWGRWSTLPVCRVRLPESVSGRVRIELTCWTADDGPQELRVALGEAEGRTRVDRDPVRRSIVLDAGRGGALITLSGVAPSRSAPWETPRGLAVARLAVFRADRLIGD